MKILMVGDIVGSVGLNKLKEELPKIKQQNQIDFIIANGENIAEGMGITERDFKELKKIGVNVITLGNHTWAKKDVFKIIEEDSIIRPANYVKNIPGHGYGIFNWNDKKIAVMSLMGRVDINVLSENPFIVADNLIQKLHKEADMIIVDFHAEATAEKIAMLYHLDGRVNAILGTHTHVQTADERVTEKGTAYITDVGMTGPKNSVIGMEVEASIKRFLTSLPERYKVAVGEAILNCCMIEVDVDNCKTKNIIRINN